MRYLIAGLIAGFVINLFVFKPAGGAAVYPLYYKSINSLEISKAAGDETFGLSDRGFIYRVDFYGKVKSKFETGKRLSSLTADGRFAVLFEKTGSELELVSTSGDRFWKMKSLEYPYISSGGKLIFLMNGDHSAVRITDINGKIIGRETIYGRICTVLSFSERNDFGVIGFFDGSYYVVNEKGDILKQGACPPGNTVKSAAISCTGKYAAVHCGDENSDRIMIVDIDKDSIETFELNESHYTAAPLQIDDSGRTIFLGHRAVTVLDSEAELLLKLPVAERRPGQASVLSAKGCLAAGFTEINGGSRCVIFTEDGDVIFSREYPGEAFLKLISSPGKITVRGAGSVFCYAVEGL